MVPKILIIESQPLHAQKLAILLEEMDFHPLSPVNNAVDAFRVFKFEQPDIIILDIDSNRKEDRVSFVQTLRDTESNYVPIIGLTSEESPIINSRTLDEINLVTLLLKPVNRFSLQRAIEFALTEIGRG